MNTMKKAMEHPHPSTWFEAQGETVDTRSVKVQE